jgi:putative peptidoglycan lipid II flippase
VITALNVVADVVLYLALPSRQKVVGLAIGFSLSYLVGTVWFARLLRARLGPSNEHRVARTHIRLAAASLVAVIPAYVASRLLTARLGLDPESSLVAVAVAVVIGAGVFAGLARRMRIRELAELTALVRSRLGPR